MELGERLQSKCYSGSMNPKTLPWIPIPYGFWSWNNVYANGITFIWYGVFPNTRLPRLFASVGVPCVFSWEVHPGAVNQPWQHSWRVGAFLKGWRVLNINVVDSVSLLSSQPITFDNGCGSL